MHMCDKQTEFLIWLLFKVLFITITIIYYYNPMTNYLIITRCKEQYIILFILWEESQRQGADT